MPALLRRLIEALGRWAVDRGSAAPPQPPDSGTYHIPHSGAPRWSLAGETVLLTLRPHPPAAGPDLVAAFTVNDWWDFIAAGSRLVKMAESRARGDDGSNHRPAWRERGE